MQDDQRLWPSDCDDVHKRRPHRLNSLRKTLKHQAVQLIRRLGGLSVGQIQDELLEERKYSLQVLHEVARQLKISLDSKISKEELVDRVVKVGFANPRGYEGLRDDHKQRESREIGVSRIS